MHGKNVLIKTTCLLELGERLEQIVPVFFPNARLVFAKFVIIVPTSPVGDGFRPCTEATNRVFLHLCWKGIRWMHQTFCRDHVSEEHLIEFEWIITFVGGVFGEESCRTCWSNRFLWFQLWSGDAAVFFIGTAPLPFLRASLILEKTFAWLSGICTFSHASLCQCGMFK